MHGDSAGQLTQHGEEKDTDFGFEKCAWSEKAQRVRGVFDSVASQLRPDERPDVRRHASAVEAFHAVAARACGPGQRALDVAGGTGDLPLACCSRWALRPRGAHRHQRRDAARGRDRLIDAGLVANVRCVAGQCRVPALRRGSSTA